jgi:Dynamin family
VTAASPANTPEVALRNTLRELRHVAANAGAGDLAAAFSQLDERLRSRRLLVAVVGEHNRGKSSLVNSLIGTPWLPIGQSAPALPPVYVFGGTREHVEIVYEDGSVAESSRDELLSLSPDDAASVSFARVAIPSSDFQGLVLIDTPGLNDPDTSRLAQTVFALLPQSDLALLMLDSAQALGASEHELIERRIARAGLQRLVVILNRDDELDDETQRAAVRDRVARMLTPLLGAEPTVLPYAARTALRARARNDERLLARSGYPELRALLEECAADRARILRTVATERARAIGQTLLSRLEAPPELPTAPGDDTADDSITQASTACRALESIRDSYRLELEAFTLALRERLIEETTESSIDDIRRYLPYFIQQEFDAFTRDHEQPVREQIQAALREAGVESWPVEQLTKAAPAPGLHPYVRPDFLEDSLLLTTFMTLVGLAMRPVVAGAVMTVGPILRMLSRGMLDKDTKTALLQAARVATSDAGLALEQQVVASFAEAIARTHGAAPVASHVEPLTIDDGERLAARESVQALLGSLTEQVAGHSPPT